MTAKRSEAPYELIPGEVPARSHNSPAPLPPPQQYQQEPQEQELSLGELFAVVLERRWLVLAITALAVALGGAYSVFTPRIWRADVLLQVDERSGGLGGLSDISGMFDEATVADTEIQILRSRLLVGAVVDELRLDIKLTPRRFPLIGDAVARKREGPSPSSAVLGMARFAWGGERADASELEVPAELLEEKLTLIAGEAGRYSLLGPEGERLLEGEVGARATGGGVSVFVQRLQARPGTQFRLVRDTREKAIAELQEELSISEKGKKTGIIEVSLEHRDRARVPVILDALARHYVRQNVDRRSAEAEQSLAFIQTQLPDLRRNLEQAEAAFKEYQAKFGQVSLTVETQATVELAGDIEKQVSMLQLERATLRQKYTEQHPAMVAADQKLALLHQRRRGIEERLRKLPDSELESARHLRDVQVATQMYLALLTKAQELNVVKSGTVGSVRLIDSAVVPRKPVAPRARLVLLSTLLVGLMLGVGAAFARRALDQGVEDPDELERQLGLPIYASVPRSGRHRQAAPRHGEQSPPLAGVDPKDLAVESLRSLRTSLQFALVDAGNNVIAITGPAPQVGKSFIVSNLAHLLGEAGQRVLVVDADLRRGQQHRIFGGARQRGLSEVIGGTLTLADAVRATESKGVWLLPTGRIPPNPAELAGSERFERVVADAAAQFDLVIIDTPPVLAVTDAVLAARVAGVKLLVLQAGRHPLREVETALRQFSRNGLRISGLVLNQVSLQRGLGRASAYHYQYRYE